MTNDETDGAVTHGVWGDVLSVNSVTICGLEAWQANGRVTWASEYPEEIDCPDCLDEDGKPKRA